MAFGKFGSRKALMARVEQMVSAYRGTEVGFWGNGHSGIVSPRDAVDLDWDLSERAAVIVYLRHAPRGMAYCGSSWCRFGCYRGEMHGDMGSADMTDGTYTWPEGYIHYIERHGVRPPDAFVQHVLSKRGRR